jgi:hypothetical protein
LLRLGINTMGSLQSPNSWIEIGAPLAGSVEDRERRLIEAVVALARSLRDERDRLAARLREVELELSRLASQLETRGDPHDVMDSLRRDRETPVRAAPLRRPTRTTV